MSNFTIQTIDSAPEASKPILETAKAQLGFVPNLYGALATSPLALTAYTTLSKLASQHSFLTAAEQQVVLIAISIKNECDYCVAAHSTIAAGQALSEDAIKALRNVEEIDDPKLEAVRRFALTLLEKRGRAPKEDVDAFLATGFTEGAVLDVVALLALKTLSNYTNHLVETPLDDAFAPRRFERVA